MRFQIWFCEGREIFGGSERKIMTLKERSKKGKQTDKHTKRERLWVGEKEVINEDRKKQAHKERITETSTQREKETNKHTHRGRKKHTHK